MKPKLPIGRPFGQPSILSSFPTKFRSSEEEDLDAKPAKQPIVLFPPDRKIRTIKEKKSAFSFVRPGGGAIGRSAGGSEGPDLPCAVFRTFNLPRNGATEETNAGDEARGGEELESIAVGESCRKRKGIFNDFPAAYGDHNPPPPAAATTRVVVLGDYPRHKPKKLKEEKECKTLYNHYVNGGGWEGIDCTEVGSSEAWEGMGSITSGDLEW